MPVHYDPGAGHLAIVCRIAHTVLPSVVGRFEFWLLFGLHLAAGCLYRQGIVELDKDGPTYLSWNDMRVISAITTFFLVFYTNACFSRYLRCYDVTRQMLGGLYDYCFELRLYLCPKGQQYARLASRTFVASMLMFFYEVNNVSRSEWDELVDQGLLKTEEREFLQQFVQQQHSRILLLWSAEAASEGCSHCKAHVKVLISLISRLVECRGLQQEVIDMMGLPTPFQYVHLLKSMLLVNLLCWAWGMALTQSVFAPLVFWVSSLTFMGMMEMAEQLADPFGDDEVDFPVTDWLDEFVENAVILMEFHSPPDHIHKSLQAEGPIQWKRSTAFKLAPRDYGGVRALDLSSWSSSDSADSEGQEMDLEMVKPLMCR